MGSAGQVTRGAVWAASSGAGAGAGAGAVRGGDGYEGTSIAIGWGWLRPGRGAATGARVGAYGAAGGRARRGGSRCADHHGRSTPGAPSSSITPGHKRLWRTARVRARSGAGTPVQTEHSRRRRCRRKRHRVGMDGPMTTRRTMGRVWAHICAGLLSPERPRCIRVSNAKKNLGHPQTPSLEMVRVCRCPGSQVARSRLHLRRRTSRQAAIHSANAAVGRQVSSGHVSRTPSER